MQEKSQKNSAKTCPKLQISVNKRWDFTVSVLLSAHAKTDSVSRIRNFVQAFHVSSTCCNSHALKSVQKMKQIVLILLMKCLSAVLQKCTSAENKKIQIILSRKTLSLGHPRRRGLYRSAMALSVVIVRVRRSVGRSVGCSKDD